MLADKLNSLIVYLFNREILILSLISICYMAVFFEAVFLHRDILSVHGINLQPLRSHIEAWTQYSFQAWHHIILNILLFVPTGMLLPLWKRNISIVRFGLLASSITAGIELTQLTLSIGIFDIDDVINNLFGAFVGFYIVKFILLLRKRSPSNKTLFVYSLPLILSAVFMLAVTLPYFSRELGNLNNSIYGGADMSHALVTLEKDFSKNRREYIVYIAKSITKEQSKQMAAEFFSKVGAKIIETAPLQESIQYKSKDKIFWIRYNDSTYRYIDGTQFDEGKVAIKNADEHTIKASLLSFGIEIPDNAVFKNDSDGIYTFQVEKQESSTVYGSITCRFYNDNTLKEIDNQLVDLQPHKKYTVISQYEAAKKITDGRFHNIYGEIHKIRIKNIDIVYELDTKGFYQPVYRCFVDLNGIATVIKIPAIPS